MSRWRRFPPPHSDPARAWLVYPGSLTTRVIARHGAMRVEILQRRMRIPNEDEYEALGRPTHKLAYVREVAARTEQYWCPIKHAHEVPAPHTRYHLFFDYGDAEGYRHGLVALRRTLPRRGEHDSRRDGIRRTRAPRRR